MAVVEPPRPERLRDQGVETEQHPDAEDRCGEEDRAADADRADRLGPEPADDHRVDDPHRHPAQLRHDTGPASASVGPNSRSDSATQSISILSAPWLSKRKVG